MQTLLSKHWHHLPANEALELLDTNLDRGLDLFEVRHRQQRFGRNELTPRKGKSPFVRFLLQFNNPLIYILLASSVITAVLKDPLDAVIIFAVVLVNAVIGFVQENNAEQAIEALAKAMVTEATVRRSGQVLRIPAAELVPGDVVLLKSGDKVPADLRLLNGRDLQIAEAALTGESLPVHKDANAALGVETSLADRKNMAYASTLVTYGQGTGVVIAIGDGTEVGRISSLISSADELATPLTRKIARFSTLVLYVILVLAAIAFAIEIWRGASAVDTFTAAIALAVAMIPEGLPAALTITLAIGVSRMAKRKAIIRKLPAVEALGSTTVICTDKTGTLTQNQMTVQQVWLHGAAYTITGGGYNPEGEIHLTDAQLAVDPSAMLEVLKAGALCNDSELVQSNGTWQPQGDPTEVALLVSARKAGLQAEMLKKILPRLDAIPFESEHQYMATLHDGGEGQTRLVYMKGAVEVVIEKCQAALDAAGNRVPLDRSKVFQQVDTLAAQGMRVLAFARSVRPVGSASIAHRDLQSGMVFLGLQAMIDPPRVEAIDAVRACQRAGIQVKMITGDHALTAAAIARQIGIHGASRQDGTPNVITGKEMAALSDSELIGTAEKISVFARVSPEQKLRLVEALQSRQHIVAMTGDGVNDGPALKQADIGVAMGITGTDVAKEAADMVLTDDNFSTIQAAVEEGRGVFDNLTKIIAWTLPTNIGEGLVILLALVLGVVLPILPIQILWINMTTVGVLGIVLALELREPGIMNRPPRDTQAPILTRELLWRIVLVGFIILIGSFSLFELELAWGSSLAQARTVAVNAVIMVAVFYLFNCRSLDQSIFQIGWFSNPWLWAGVGGMALLQTLFTYLPFLNRLLSSAPIGVDSWLRILVVGLTSFVVIEFEKWLRRRVKSASGKMTATIEAR